MNYDLNEGRLQNQIEMTISDYARVYNIDYSLSFPCELNRFYYYDKSHENFNLNIKIIDDVTICEGISYVCNFLKELGIDPLVNLNGTKEIKTYLDYLDIDTLLSESKEINFEITDEEKTLGNGKVSDGYIIIQVSLDAVRSLMRVSSKDIPDVCIYAKTEEEKLKASIIMQDLRLNNIVCIYTNDLNKIGDYDVKHLISLNDDDLNKGLVSVKDHLTKDEKKVPEDEIIDYILGII